MLPLQQKQQFMNYPLISEYIEAIKASEDNFDELKHLRPVLDDDGEPMMTSGNFAVVFKMKDEQTGKLHAVKCFLKEQEGRADAYRMIAEELEYVNSTFLTPIKYLDKELFVDSKNSNESEFPVLLMDWVEGQTLDKYIREHIDNQYELSLLAYQFSRLAMWLMPQPFAHGDLKPDNILVKDDGTLVLVDYDGMYVPAMKGQRARELGSPDFRHPSRTEEVFDDHIDDFSLASILLSLKAISLQPSLLEEYGASDRLLFSEKDYRNISESRVMDALKPLMQDAELASLYSLFILALSQNNLSQVSFRLFNLSRPDKPEQSTWMPYDEPYSLKEIWDISNPGLYEQIDGDVAEIKVVTLKNGSEALRIFIPLKDGTSYELKVSPRISEIDEGDIVWIPSIKGQEFHKAGCDPIVLYDGELYLSTFVSEEDFANAWEDEYGVKYSKDRKQLLKAPQEIKEYTIKSGTKIIRQNAFFSCKSLTSVIIPDTVEIIGDYSFTHCESLLSLSIPDSVIVIGKCAFCRCKSLTEIMIPSSVKKIFAGAFANIEKLSSIVVDDKNCVYDSRCSCNAIVETKTDTLIVGCPATVIPDFIKSIGYNAFYACHGLKSLVIPNGVTKIVWGAFSNCSELVSITLPTHLKNVEEHVFEECEKLSTLYIPIGTKEKYEELLPSYKDKLVEQENYYITDVTDDDYTGAWTDEYGVTYSEDGRSLLSAQDINTAEYCIREGTQIICDHAFNSCTSLRSIEIPNCVNVIGEASFGYCHSLISVLIPGSVKTIKDCAFSGCYALKTVSIQDGLTSIGGYAFSHCESLKVVYLPKSVSSFGNLIDDGYTSWNGDKASAFDYCNSLESIMIPKGTREQFEKLLPEYKNKLVEQHEEENLSTKVTDEDLANAWEDEQGIWYNASKSKLLGVSNKEIESCIINSGTKVICDWAFHECSFLRSVAIPESVNEIGFRAFFMCEAIESLVIPDSVYDIKDAAFADCSSLKKIVLPNSINNLGHELFQGCISLESITIPQSVVCIREHALGYCKSLKKITIPQSVSLIEEEAFSDCQFEITNYSCQYKTFGYDLYSVDKRVLLYVSQSIARFTIPNTVVKIGNSVFAECLNLQSIIIPDSVNIIGDSAFVGCESLKELSFPKSIKIIGKDAFGSCSSIKNITIPESVSSIGDNAFEDCSSLLSVTFCNIVPKMGNRLFQSCTSLKSIFIPNGCRKVFEDLLPDCKFKLIEKSE